MVYAEISVTGPPTERISFVADCKVNYPVLKWAWPLKMALLDCPKTSLSTKQRCVISQGSEDQVVAEKFRECLILAIDQLNEQILVL